MTPNIRQAKGPFTLLAITLVVSELLLGGWMLYKAADSYERIVAGSLSVAVLIAFLVVFCVVFKIKTEFYRWRTSS